MPQEIRAEAGKIAAVWTSVSLSGGAFAASAVYWHAQSFVESNISHVRRILATGLVSGPDCGPKRAEGDGSAEGRTIGNASMTLHKQLDALLGGQ